MRAGKLRKRITFTAPTAVKDAYGQDIPTWTPVATVWAAVKPLSGRLLALAQANTVTATATHEIRIRYRDDIKIGFHHILYGSGIEAAQPSQTYETLTVAQYQAIDADEDDSTEPDAREFTISSILDVDEMHRELVLTVTEVKK